MEGIEIEFGMVVQWKVGCVMKTKKIRSVLSWPRHSCMKEGINFDENLSLGQT